MSGAGASKRDAAQPSQEGPRGRGLSAGPDPLGSGRLRGVPTWTPLVSATNNCGTGFMDQVWFQPQRAQWFGWGDRGQI